MKRADYGVRSRITHQLGEPLKASLALLAILPALGLAVSPLGYAQPIKVTVVAVESVSDFKRWLGEPVNAARAATYPGRLMRVPFGTKTHLPIVVTGLPSPAPQDTRYVADVEILGTDGRSMGTSPRCCEAAVARGSREDAVLLNSTVIVEPESGHQKGSYTVRVTVTDGVQTWTTSEVLAYGATDLPGTANEAPRLRMNVPAGQTDAAGPGDKRNCLDLPTPAEVIKCSEKK